MPLEIIIIGGGIAGLTAAVALRRASHHVKVSLAVLPCRAFSRLRLSPLHPAVLPCRVALSTDARENRSSKVLP
jgi:2-polyprenyl-6-methoxyphenol hydroxylase-like FAD-dependent oxidoreductase